MVWQDYDVRAGGHVFEREHRTNPALKYKSILGIVPSIVDKGI